MPVVNESLGNWCDAESGCVSQSEISKRPEVGRDSGCDMSSSSTADSPSSYRRRINNDDNSTGSLTCSSCDATVDQNSKVYQQLSEARLNNTFATINGNLTGCESSVALAAAADGGDDDQLGDSLGSDNLGLEDSEQEKNRQNEKPFSFHPLDSIIASSEPMASRKSRGRLLPQVLASLVLAIAAMIEGYSSGYTSPALASMTQANSSIPVNDQQVRQWR